MSSRYCAGFSPIDANPVMSAISSTSIETSCSNHKNPQLRTAINYLTQLLTSFPLPKWGISSRFRMPVLAKPATHGFGCRIGSPKGHVPILSRYTSCANSGNLSASATSWSEYFNFSTHHRSVGVVCTPSGMCSSMMVASGCLRGAHVMGCLSFLLSSPLEVRASNCLFLA